MEKIHFFYFGTNICVTDEAKVPDAADIHSLAKSISLSCGKTRRGAVLKGYFYQCFSKVSECSFESTLSFICYGST